MDKAVQVKADSLGTLQSFPTECSEVLVEKVSVPMNMYLCHVVLYRGTLNDDVYNANNCSNTERVSGLNSKIVLAEDKNSSSQSSDKVDHESQPDIAIPARAEPIRTCCTSCNEVINLKNLKRHQETCNCLYSCANCRKTFSDSAALVVHIEELHNADKLQYACTKCGEIYVTSQNFAIHSEACVASPALVCKLCSKVFLKRSRLNDHLGRKHADRPRRALCTCPFCEKPFSGRIVMQEHFALDHPGVRPYKCKICAKDFTTPSLRSSHMVVHRTSRRYQCTQCEKKFSRAMGLREHVKYIHIADRKYLCQFCSRGFITTQDLRKHEAACRDGKYTKCNLCGLSFVNYSSLKMHMRKHARERRMRDPNSRSDEQIPFVDAETFPCAECGRVLSSDAQRSRHVTRCHGAARPFMCSYCSKRFPNRSVLDRHMRGHTGEKPFACAMCPKRFTQATSLNDHVLLLRGIRPHKCTECGKCFTQSSSLRSHRRVHNRAIV